MPHPVILHVEDEPDDAFILQIALRKARLACELRCARDGDQALQYLQGLGCFSDRSRFPLPDLVLLDLKLPLVDGFEVLTWARARPEFKMLPIVILSGSSIEQDQTRALQLGATACFVKSYHYQDVVQYAARLLSAERPRELPLQTFASVA
jgi:CheY-like chemotaxis protein